MNSPQQSIETLYATGHWLLGSGRHGDAAVVFRAMALVASTDERAWLALGACHEAAGQLQVACTLYAIGSGVAPPAVRCAIAQSRSLRALGREDEADAALERASELAEETGEDELRSLVRNERRSQS